MLQLLSSRTILDNHKYRSNMQSRDLKTSPNTKEIESLTKTHVPNIET
jgi:hypothetical protein